MDQVLNLFLVSVLPLLLYFTSLSILQTLFLALVIFVVAFYVNSDPQSSGLPPGPRGFPVLGRLPFAFIYSNHYQPMLDLHSKYGPVITNPFGSVQIILISDYQLIKEFGIHPDFQLRPDYGVLKEITNGLGLISSEGNLWKHQRRFLLNALRNAGMGQDRMREKINDELNRVKNVFLKSKGEPILIHSLLEKSTSNIMFSLAFNKHFDYKDEEFIQRIEALDENFKLMATVGIFAMLKWLQPFSKFLLRKLHANISLLKSQSQEFIDEHKHTIDPDDPRDLLDHYLLEMGKTSEDKESEYHKSFFEEQLKFFIIDIFAGGTETSSKTIRWALLYMIHYPEVQDKVQVELDDVLGTDGIISTEDKSKLPYTVATLQEIERLASVVPLSLPRSNDREIIWQGYRFPKRSTVGFNLYAAHRDPKYWNNPNKFDPSRFIDSEGKVFRPPQLLAFGSGRRACPGEALGRMEIFLYFTTLLKNFKFENPPGEPMPSFKSPRGVLRGPYDYKLSCFPR